MASRDRILVLGDDAFARRVRSALSSTHHKFIHATQLSLELLFNSRQPRCIIVDGHDAELCASDSVRPLRRWAPKAKIIVVRGTIKSDESPDVGAAVSFTRLRQAVSAIRRPTVTPLRMR